MISCRKCFKKITKPEDINVLAFLSVKPVVFCNSCYASRERGLLRHWLYAPRWGPLNSKIFLISLVAGTMVSFVLILAMIMAETSLTRKMVITLIILLLLTWWWTLRIIATRKVKALEKGR